MALPIGMWIRYELDPTRVDLLALGRLLTLALIAQWTIGSAAKMYRGRYRVGSLDEATNLARVVSAAGLGVLGVDRVLTGPSVPLSVFLTAALLALLIGLAVRLAIRRNYERAARPDRASAHRVLIFGAGEDGERLVRAMQRDPTAGYVPVALLDDDPAKRRLHICGIPVRGTRRDIDELAVRTGATLLVIAIPNPDAGLLRDIASLVSDIGVRVLPPLNDLFRPRADLAALCDLDLLELLGRPQVDTHIDEIGGYLRNQRVLVTGAGGSIGSELCRQIHRFSPAELIMLDHDESALHAVQLSIYGCAPLDSPDVILADIRDVDAVRAAFERCRPTVVFHAAALKHLPMLEQYPLEAWKTNVLGTLHVLDAARSVGVATFVNISTDKAANPSSMLGRSKRVGERLVADAAGRVDGTYLSVRFGNVLGSRGSVLTTFAHQLTRGGPITVTHPDVTRYFMTIPEAVRLVIHAAAIGKSGQALVLDMGAQVRIADVARQLMRMAGRSAQIVYTGLRSGEKLHEELFGHGERGEQTLHPSISHICVPPLDPMELAPLALLRGEVAVMTECARDRQPAIGQPIASRA
jgi:FlaA1/EpsC-like NDP-sugar epimerase